MIKTLYFTGNGPITHLKDFCCVTLNIKKMLHMITDMDLSSVKSLVTHYNNSTTPAKLTQTISAIHSFHNLSSPMKQVNNGWIPDFNSRYFSADFPFVLAIIEAFANVIGSDVPMIKKGFRMHALFRMQELWLMKPIGTITII